MLPAFMLLLLGWVQLTDATCKVYGSVQAICLNTTLEHALSSLPANLQTLTITDSNLGTLETNTFSNHSLDNLTTLNLPGNGIATIQDGAFEGLAALEILDLSFNALKNLPDGSFNGIPALKALNLAQNELESVPSLTAVAGLVVLNLNSNHLSLLPCGAFDPVDQLKVLYLESNQLSTLQNCSLGGLDTLEELSLRMNHIESIENGSFTPTPNLKRLDFSFNKLTSLPERLLEPVGANLISVTFTNSNFAKVPLWGNLSKLQHLDLAANELLSVESDAFNSLPNLEELYLVDMITLQSVATGAFNNLTKLRTLVVTGNKKVSVFPATPDLQNLEQLRIHNNGIRTFPKELLQTWGSLPKLKRITLEDNPIHCDCSAEYFRDFILTSGVAWVKDWNTELILCSTPINFKGKKLVNVQPRDLTCDAPVVVADSPRVSVDEGGLLEVSVMAYGGIPSSVWITPGGVTVKPGEEKIGFTVREVIAPNNAVTSTILKEVFTPDDAGPFTVVFTNANSGTSTTVRVTTSPIITTTEGVVVQAPEDVVVENSEDVVVKESEDVVSKESKDVVSQESEGVVSHESEDVVSQESEGVVVKESEGVVVRESEDVVVKESEDVVGKESEDVVVQDTVGRKLLPGRDGISNSNIDIAPRSTKDFETYDEPLIIPKVSNTTIPTLDEQIYVKRNMIGAFVAFFFFLISVLFVFAIVRKRRRDVLYHRLPSSRTVFYVQARRNYGALMGVRFQAGQELRVSGEKNEKGKESDAFKV